MLRRRQFIGTGLLVALSAAAKARRGQPASTADPQQFDVVEIDLGRAPRDPWAELDVVFTGSDGAVRTVPAFMRRNRWIARFSSVAPGAYTWRSNGRTGRINVVARRPGSGRLSRGPLKVSADSRRFEHADGTPFLWLADTWWHAFVSVKCSDAEFARLAAQRAKQGFSVVQLVAGLPCEVRPFDEAGSARAGWAWRPGFEAINLPWWDDADARVATLLANDLMPCIVGSWGFHLSVMTSRQLARHWREMIARWGAYPVVWCLAGEPQSLWYEDVGRLLARATGTVAAGDDKSEWGLDRLRNEIAGTRQKQMRALNDIARTVRAVDPFRRLITTHTVPNEYPWNLVDDEALLDFWFLQTGHWGYASLSPTMAAIHKALDHQPVKPVVNGEVNYEGIGGSSWQDIQRFLFWSHLMAGAAGFSYGAHGVWAFNTERFPGQFSGLAPHWKQAAALSGATQVGIGRKVLLRYPWHDLVPAGDIVSPHATGEAALKPYAARLPDGRRLIYCPSIAFNGGLGSLKFLQLGDRPWRATRIDLTSGEAFPPVRIVPKHDGTGTIPALFWPMPSWSDWLVELTRETSEAQPL